MSHPTQIFGSQGPAALESYGSSPIFGHSASVHLASIRGPYSGIEEAGTSGRGQVPLQLLLVFYILSLLTVFGEGFCLIFNASSNRKTFALIADMLGKDRLKGLEAS